MPWPWRRPRGGGGGRRGGVVSDRPWKAFDRDVARLLAGRRFCANSGERLVVEFETPAQCKLVRVLSPEQLALLAEAVERATFTAEIVCVKVLSIVCPERVWRALNGKFSPPVDDAASEAGGSTAREAEEPAAV